MTFEIGDIVQITWADQDLASSLGEAYSGMIGTVIELNSGRDGTSIGVYFNCGPMYRDKISNFHGFKMPLDPNDLTKIGTAALLPDVEKINRFYKAVRQKLMDDPEVQKVFAKMEHREKYSHLQMGSPEALEQGCLCSEVRNFECLLHAPSIGEFDRLNRRMNDVVEERPDHQ